VEYAPHKKTILIVDDEPTILEVVSRLLGDSEYHILTASTGSMGLEQSREFKGEIALLLSDFQMPGVMSGVDLAIAMTRERPQLKVLLMSGFPEGMLVLNRGWHFLPKPFIASQLRALVTGLVFPRLPPRAGVQPRAAVPVRQGVTGAHAPTEDA
jgi:DNA-binding NtrC family response regulator